jgi:hypothetical protein
LQKKSGYPGTPEKAKKPGAGKSKFLVRAATLVEPLIYYKKRVCARMRVMRGKKERKKEKKTKSKVATVVDLLSVLI